MKYPTVIFTAIICLLSCNVQEVTEHNDDKAHHHDATHANEHMHHKSFHELVNAFERTERAAWQNIDTILHLLGNIEDKTIADIGSGTGYFSFPLAEKAKKIIAIDIDQRFLDYIQQKKDSLSIGDNIELRLAREDNSGIAINEVDIAIIVNTYHHIENRISYFKQVNEALKDGGKLVVIDFFKEQLPVGPPPAHKLAAEVIVQELIKAGFSNVTTDRETLQYQYIITAHQQNEVK